MPDTEEIHTYEDSEDESDDVIVRSRLESSEESTLYKMADVLSNVPGFILFGIPTLIGHSIISIFIKEEVVATESYDTVDYTASDYSILHQIAAFGKDYIFPLPYHVFVSLPVALGNCCLHTAQSAYRQLIGETIVEEQSSVRSELLSDEDEEEVEETLQEVDAQNRKSLLGWLMDFVLCVLYVTIIMLPLSVGNFVWDKISRSWAAMFGSGDDANSSNLANESFIVDDDSPADATDSFVFGKLLSKWLWLPIYLIFELPTSVGKIALQTFGFMADPNADPALEDNGIRTTADFLSDLPYNIFIRPPLWLLGVLFSPFTSSKTETYSHSASMESEESASGMEPHEQELPAQSSNEKSGLKPRRSQRLAPLNITENSDDDEEEEDLENIRAAYADSPIYMRWLWNVVNGLIIVLGFLLVTLPTGWSSFPPVNIS